MKKGAPKKTKEIAAISSTINAKMAERNFPLNKKESQGAIMAISIITYKKLCLLFNTVFGLAVYLFMLCYIRRICKYTKS